MKNRILSTFGLFVAAVFIFSSCTKSEIEKAREAYDWSKVQPKIFGFTGPTSGAASGLAAVTYKVDPRGGSTYTFETIGHGATIVIDDEWPHIAYVTWDQSGVSVDAQITVYETTAGGLSSDKDTLDVSLTAFCPKSINDFVSASWTGSEFGSSNVDPLNVTFVAGTGDVIIADASTNGIPAFLSEVFTGWGEEFQPGFGNEGDIYLTIGLLDGSVTGSGIYWGQTEPGSYDYWQLIDNGGWSGCGSFTMSFSFGLDWSNDGKANRQSEVTLTQN